MYKHIVQSKAWAEVKDEYGTPSEKVGEVYYTKHKIPGTNYYYAYCPRVNPALVNFEKLKNSLRENNCIGLTFDVPNVIKGSPEEKKTLEMFKKYCTKSKRSEFAQANILLDLKKSERELFSEMHKKHRYNTRYAARKGVTIRLAESQEDFDQFFKLFEVTAVRQNYFVRPKKYYQIIWEKLHPKGMCHILIAEYGGDVQASWMIFMYDRVLYYPYGGSSESNKNIFASNALGWEMIRFGKEKGCEIFDMWGAALDPEDTRDTYHGFTNFKLKFGGEHVRYIDSYDLVVKRIPYILFSAINSFRWKLLDLGLIK